MINRRGFVAGSVAGLMCSNAFGGNTIPEDKSVIWIWLGGGISQIELLNPLPDGPSECRSVRGHVEAKGGYLLGGDFVELAKIGNYLTVVRSMNHRDANHETATHWVNNSKFQIPNQGQSWPHNGAVIAKYYGNNNPKNGIPTFVKIDKIVYDDAAFLGTNYMGYDADQEGIKNMSPNVDRERFDRRIGLMKGIDGTRKAEKGGMVESWNNLKGQTVGIITGSAGKAFNLQLESAAAKKNFDIDKNNFGKNCLLAARLVENGVKFVTLQHGGWDMHADISRGFQMRAPDLDMYLAKLIAHLEERGTLSKTLIVVASEFSRTYKVNLNAGRDHFPGTNSLIFAGGGFEHGRAIGETSKNGSEVVSNIFDPEDLAFTIYDHFGMKKPFDVMDIQGRPRNLIPDGKNILKS